MRTDRDSSQILTALGVYEVQNRCRRSTLLALSRRRVLSSGDRYDSAMHHRVIHPTYD